MLVSVLAVAAVLLTAPRSAAVTTTPVQDDPTTTTTVDDSPVATLLTTTTSTTAASSTTTEDTTTTEASTATTRRPSGVGATTTVDPNAPAGADLLVPGDGTEGAESTTPTVRGTRISSGPSDGTLISLVIVGLLIVALAIGILTWRYWAATRPPLLESDARPPAE